MQVSDAKIFSYQSQNIIITQRTTFSVCLFLGFVPPPGVSAGVLCGLSFLEKSRGD